MRNCPKRVNKLEGFLNMLHLRKPHHASLFLLLMAKESCKALLLMISRKAVRECGKWCRNYQTDIESEEHCELGKYSGKLQALQPCVIPQNLPSIFSRHSIHPYSRIPQELIRQTL